MKSNRLPKVDSGPMQAVSGLFGDDRTARAANSRIRNAIIKRPESIFELDGLCHDDVRLAFYGIVESPKKQEARSKKPETQWLKDRDWKDLVVLSGKLAFKCLQKEDVKKPQKLIRVGKVWNDKGIRLEARMRTWLYDKAPRSALSMIFSHEGFGWRAEPVLSELANCKFAIPQPIDCVTRNANLDARLEGMKANAEFFKSAAEMQAPKDTAQSLIDAIARLKRYLDNALCVGPHEVTLQAMQVASLHSDLTTLADSEYLRDNRGAANFNANKGSSRGYDRVEKVWLKLAHENGRRRPGINDVIEALGAKTFRQAGKLCVSFVPLIKNDGAFNAEEITLKAFRGRLDTIAMRHPEIAPNPVGRRAAKKGDKKK